MHTYGHQIVNDAMQMKIVVFRKGVSGIEQEEKEEKRWRNREGTE